MEPITAGPARPVQPLLRASLCDVAFLHWRVSARQVAGLVPPGTAADEFAGTSYAGLVVLRLRRAGLAGLPGVPYLGSFGQVNVRLYAVGADGRRGVVFRSFDAARLLPAAAARAVLRLPYHWAAVRVHRDGDVLTCTAARRWPAPGPRLRLRLRIGPVIGEPSELEHFLTARWGLHVTWHTGRAGYLPVAHPPWQLRRAELLGLAQDLVAAAGVPAAGPPDSVLYSPGTILVGGPVARPGTSR